MQRISRREVLRAGLATAALAALPSSMRRAIADAPPVRRPNILLIVADDQRADSLGCSGNTILKTPSIDALAKNGVRFRQSLLPPPSACPAGPAF